MSHFSLALFAWYANLSLFISRSFPQRGISTPSRCACKIHMEIEQFNVNQLKYSRLYMQIYPLPRLLPPAINTIHEFMGIWKIIFLFYLPNELNTAARKKKPSLIYALSLSLSFFPLSQCERRKVWGKCSANTKRKCAKIAKHENFRDFYRHITTESNKYERKKKLKSNYKSISRCSATIYTTKDIYLLVKNKMLKYMHFEMMLMMCSNIRKVH